MRFILLSLLSLSFMGCKDKLYPDPKEKVQYNFSGVVELGAPVANAKVEAYSFLELKKGEKLAEAQSAIDGSFALNLYTEYEGPLLLVSTGGTYRDLVTGQTVAIKPDDELNSAITHIKMPEKTNINAWTTLAVARVQADNGFWDKKVSYLNEADRIDADFSRMSRFLSGKPSSYLNIRRQGLFRMENNTLDLEDPRTLLYFTHGGLSVLARIATENLPSGYEVSIMDYVTALAKDLTDRVFDGKSAYGHNIYLHSSQLIPLDGDTMRKRFSESILRYGELIKDWSDSQRYQLSKMVKPISVDKSPDFFREDDNPAPLDSLPPLVLISFKDENYEQKRIFSVMSGDVYFKVTADDETGVAEIKSLSPREEVLKEDGLLGPFGIDFAADPKDAVHICDVGNEFNQIIKANNISEQDVLCACFEAKDVFGNAEKSLSCFRREKITPVIEFPTHRALLTAKDLEDGTSIKAQITSGVNLSTCGWYITNDPKLEALNDKTLEGHGLIEGNKCVIDEPLPIKSLPNGEYKLIIVADDIHKRKLSFTNSEQLSNVVSFKIAKEPPVVEILSPKQGDFIAKHSINVFGSFQDKEHLAKVTLTYKGIDSRTEKIEGSLDLILTDPVDMWKAELGYMLPEGAYELGLKVVDIYGNTGSIKPLRITLDHSAPTIEPTSYHLLTPSINGYKQTFAQDRNGMDKIRPIQIVQQENGKTKFSRWSIDVAREIDAPTFKIAFKDDNRLREIRYSIDETCSNIDKSKLLGRKNGIYEIKVLPRFASTDLYTSKDLCLRVWAIDKAGNAHHHDTNFFWEVTTPPVSVHLNSRHFSQDRMEQLYYHIVSNGFNYRIKSGAELGYAVITNQFAIPLEASLALNSPMTLDLRVDMFRELSTTIHIPAKYFDVHYFAYDRVNDKLGQRLYSNNGDRVWIDGTSSVVAKFVINEAFDFETRVVSGLISYYEFLFPQRKNNLSGLTIKTSHPRSQRVTSHEVYYSPSQVLQRGWTL